MTQVFLIDQDDIKEYRPTAELEEGRVNPYIFEAQIQDLKPILNNALYYDFITKFAATGDPMYATYQELLNGKVWEYEGNTEQFEGVKPMLCYYALARYAEQNPIHITKMGVVIKTTTNSTPVDRDALRAYVADLRSSAMTYQNEVIKFLENNSSTYPLYVSGGSSTNQGKRTSFNFFKA